MQSLVGFSSEGVHLSVVGVRGRENGILLGGFFFGGKPHRGGV